MISFLSKKTSKLTNLDEKKILLLKNEFWKKGFRSQKSWFKNKIKSFDIHNLLYFNKKLIGYTCLRYRSKQANNRKSKYLLFDTLIISRHYREKGIGRILMFFNNMIIEEYNLPSFLVCEKKTINFYKKNKWKVVKNNLYSVKDESYFKKVGMIFNFNLKHKIQIWVNK